jgi:hypothetical protein
MFEWLILGLFLVLALILPISVFRFFRNAFAPIRSEFAKDVRDAEAAEAATVAARDNYRGTLALLKSNPTDPELRAKALALGRYYLLRLRGSLDLRDEVAVANDIDAACAAAGFKIVPERDERECPYCAELVLSKAKVCKHCGRDIAEPTGRTAE